MIIGVFLRYIKTYQGINYIPLTNGDSFCGLVGNNGVGKSSILESLDCFFNNRSWNYNITTKKSGLDSTNPYIVPVFLIKKSLLDGEAKIKAESLSSVAFCKCLACTNLARYAPKKIPKLAANIKERGYSSKSSFSTDEDEEVPELLRIIKIAASSIMMAKSSICKVPVI